MDHRTALNESAVHRPVPLTARVYRHVSELAPLAAAWDELVFTTTARSPVTSHAWVASHLEVYNPSQHPILCLAAFDGPRLVGVLPLGQQSVRVFGKTMIKFTSPGEPRANSVDTVIAPGYERGVLALFREMLDAEVPDWFGLELRWVDHQSPLVNAGRSAVPGCVAVHHAAGLASVIKTTGGWERYCETISRSLRKTLRRAKAKLEDLPDVRWQFHVGDDVTPEHLHRFLQLEASGWKGAAGSALAVDPKKRWMHEALCARLRGRRALEWHFLRSGDRDIAAELVVRSGRTQYFYKIAYDENFATCAPGILLRERSLMRAFDDPAIDGVNLVSDRPLHQSWCADKVPYYHIWLYPGRPRSLVAGAWPAQVRQTLRGVPLARKLANAIRKARREGSAIQGRRDFLQSRGKTES